MFFLYLVFRICLVGSNPSHLIKSNVLYNDIKRYCHPDKWCYKNNEKILCPLYSAICNKSTNTFCSFDRITESVQAVPAVPGLKDWQLSGYIRNEWKDDKMLGCLL